jgi:hypothetical protein
LVDVSLQRVGKDEEPIFDSFILRGNVAASVMSGVSRTKCQVKHSQTLFHIAQKLRSALHPLTEAILSNPKPTITSYSRGCWPRGI